MSARRAAALTLLLALCAACGRGDDREASYARGRGLKPAALSPATEALVYEESARAMFDIGPGLTLLLHPRRLPRTSGYDGGDAVPAAVVGALREGDIIRGTCEPRRDAPRDTPRCERPEAGYVLRGSDVFRSGGDTVQVYLAAEVFAAATGKKPQAQRFEKIYQLLPNGAGWRVVREARSPEGNR